jgi:NAD(P)H dehydrogenase (quinone)
MIVVTGATGQLGGAVMSRLLTRLPAAELAVSVRDPATAEHLAERGVRVRRGDFTEPATLKDAFEGASRLLIVSGPAGAAPHRAAIDAAAAAGVERIVYTSHMAAGPGTLFVPAQGHAETERDLQASGIPFTSLRDGFHASSALFMLGRGLQTGEVRLPADGPVSWTAQADLAEAAALALTNPERLQGITPALTGAAALDMADLVAIVSELTGRTITRTVVPDEEYLADLVAAGTPEEYTDIALTFFTAARRGEFAAVDPTLAGILGRAPVAVRDVLVAGLGG